jgi:hypothetical protein
MALVGRFFVIIFAVIAASLVTGIAIAMGLAGPHWQGFSGDIGERASFWILVFFTTGITGASIGVLPLILFVVVTEGFKLRSLLIYAAAGAVMLTIGYYGGVPKSGEESIDNPPPMISRNTEVVAAGGIVFGLIYWLIAGRNAGRWRERT